MHDLDYTTLEGDFHAPELAHAANKTAFHAGPFTEAETMELASELLTLSGEAELEYFLGDLFKKAVSAVKSAVSSPIGQAVLGGLKTVAKAALPIAGTALGNLVVPGLGGVAGGMLASGAGKLLGLEFEGLSAEDREFEVAKQIVSLTGAAAQNAANAGPGAPAAIAAKALTEAVHAVAPALIPLVEAAQAQRGHHGHHARHEGHEGAAGGAGGRWYRRGNKIILVGV